MWSGRSGTLLPREHPREHLHTAAAAAENTAALQREEEIPPVPTRHAPTSLTCRPAGPCNLHIFSPHLSQACQGRKFRGLQLQRLLATLVSRRPASPRKGKTELRPDLPMLTNSNYHGLWCKGGWGKYLCASALAHHRAGRCNLKKGRQTHAQVHTHTHVHTPIINGAVDRNGGMVLPGQAGVGRHRGHFSSFKVRPRMQGAVSAAWKIRAIPRGQLESNTRFTRQVTDRPFPYTESTHRNKKEQNKYT